MAPQIWPQTASATSTQRASLLHWSSSVRSLPCAVEEKPHWWLKRALLERHVARGLVDAALDARPSGSTSARFELIEAEHDGLALRHEAQRREVAGALVVVLEEEAVDSISLSRISATGS